MTYLLPPSISEREDAHLWPDGRQDDAVDEDCVWCSTLWLLCAAYPERGIPATHAEAEALRSTVTGPLGGSTVEQAAQAVRLRYGITMTIVTGDDAAVWSALDVGKAMAIIGAPSNVASTSPIRTYVPTFLGLHCVAIARIDDTDTVAYIDPEAPNDSAPRTVTKADLLKFYEGNHALVVALKEEPVSIYEKIVQSGSFKVTAGVTAKAMKLDSSGFTPTGASATSGAGRYDYILHRISGDLPPTAVIHVASGLWAGFFINTGHVDEVADAVPASYSKAQLDAAVLAAAQHQYDLDAASVKITSPRPS